MVDPKMRVVGEDRKKTGRVGGPWLLAKGSSGARHGGERLDVLQRWLEARGAEVVVADIVDPSQLMAAMRDRREA